VREWVFVAGFGGRRYEFLPVIGEVGNCELRIANGKWQGAARMGWKVVTCCNRLAQLTPRDSCCGLFGARFAFGCFELLFLEIFR
jgi:hypothetical protein